MACPVRNHVLVNLEQVQILSEVLEKENISQFSSDDNFFNSDCTQIVTWNPYERER
jgi:hypothetical protein